MMPSNVLDLATAIMVSELPDNDDPVLLVMFNDTTQRGYAEWLERGNALTTWRYRNVPHNGRVADIYGGVFADEAAARRSGWRLTPDDTFYRAEFTTDPIPQEFSYAQ